MSEAIAAVVAILASDEPRYVTGVVLRADGELLAAQPYLAELLGRRAVDPLRPADNGSHA
ncbi:MAG: hypothetical protein JWP52_4579 [Rhizobacter sp.]|nr:hypothetical protein [Rhizobacter sp.]